MLHAVSVYCARLTASACCARRVNSAGVHGLLRPIQNLRAAMRAARPRVYARLEEHRAITRLSLASLALAVALGVSLQNASAGQTLANRQSLSLLPENVGIGVITTDPIVVEFDNPMDPASVHENMAISPGFATRTVWSADHRRLALFPLTRWATDARYAVTVGAGARRQDGVLLGVDRSVSFTTQTAPVVTDFQVHLLSVSDERTAARIATPGGPDAPIPYAAAEVMMLADAPLIDAPEDTLGDASSETSIRIAFATAMDRKDVESRFSIVPAVKGSFSWREHLLTFVPRDRLKADTRYAVSLVGAHDAHGNRLSGDVSYSFTTRIGAELMRLMPGRHAENVMAKQVAIRFSQPMNRRITADALRVVNVSRGRLIRGTATWSQDARLLEYRFSDPLPRGAKIDVRLGKAARDMAGNRVSIHWTFQTRPRPVAAATATAPASRPPVAPAPATGPAAPADLQEYGLWLINQSRAQYGFGPLRLDGGVSAVASAHAWDQLNYGYFSHTGRDGSSISDRLRRGGVSFSWSGENMCYYNGLGLRAMLEWCHSTFMSEPYPGFANHIGNILSANFNRLGIGIAQSGGRVIIVWDFAG